MADRRSWFTASVRGWLAATALIVVIGLGLATGAPQRSGPVDETWRALVQTGDELAAGELTATLGGQPLTAGQAYLLAFHQAQDTTDLEHVLAVGDRLDAAGEPDLAAHVRRAADFLLEEFGR